MENGHQLWDSKIPVVPLARYELNGAELLETKLVLTSDMVVSFKAGSRIYKLCLDEFAPATRVKFAHLTKQIKLLENSAREQLIHSTHRSSSKANRYAVHHFTAVPALAKKYQYDRKPETAIMRLIAALKVVGISVDNSPRPTLVIDFGLRESDELLSCRFASDGTLYAIRSES
jgi:thioredoxin-like negative regulator of GroEL